MIVLGGDLSLAATGVVLWDTESRGVVAYELVRTKEDKEDHYSLQRRTHHIWKRVLFFAKRSDRICIEQLAPSPSNSDNRPASVSGVILYRLWRQNYQFRTVHNNTLKLHATGLGRASKGEMVAAAALEGFEPDVPASLRHNVVDAYWAARWLAEGSLD